MAHRFNPIHRVVLAVGAVLQRFGLVDHDRTAEAAELSWPRIVTGIARMSKNAVDVAMVGVALGSLAIAGVGFASPFWGLAFSLGGGIAAGSIALVSQRFGADAYDDIGAPIRHSVTLVLVGTVPLTLFFAAVPETLIGFLTDDPTVLAYGSDYLRVVAFGIPFAALNLIGSRVYIGVDDAWTPMVLRATGAIVNIGLNAVFIFGLDMGVVGAALGTVLSNAVITVAFFVGLTVRRIPGTRPFPAPVSVRGRYTDRETLSDLVSIGLPVIGRNSVWTVARFPMLAIVGLFGPTVVAAYVIARRIWGLLNTPGWGFGLAASSLVGQELGADDEDTAAAYGREITLLAIGTYAIGGVLTALFAERIVRLFVDSSADPSIPVAVGLVYVACVAVIPQAVKATVAGALDATGDTRWPFYSQVLGMFVVGLPLAYLGATTALGIWGLYLSFFAEAAIPAVINYYRFTTGKWRAISREYRPNAAKADD
ncbi:MATE family efflux transporter [Halapricum sp. CBA1109]|uniref:MATE family efflux transporter n=1 Tax=Halapricum sp. CBA1109 TaxID=2668068 RepID=UPI0013B83C6A|nr:MATE family efflux transporter [Halapricum sp. CBA1109]